MEFTYTESLRRVIVKAYHIDTGIVSNLSLMIEENESNGYISLSINYNDVCYEIKSDNLYLAFQHLKDQLLSELLGLQCHGSLENVHNLPKSRDNTVVYILTLGKETSVNDIVNIFGFIEITSFATSKQQEVYYNQWLESL